MHAATHTHTRTQGLSVLLLAADLTQREDGRRVSFARKCCNGSQAETEPAYKHPKACFSHPV